MEEDLQQLGEDVITTAARIVRWVPTDGLTMSLASARILARLFDHGALRISDIAALESSSQPTITNHIKRLEAEQLVERSADATDARAWKITLTEKGRQELAGMKVSIGSSLQPYLAQLPQRDLKALRQGIEAMRRLMAADRLRE